MSQPLHLIVTHAGSFHADEVMAVVLLERFYLLRPVVVSIDTPTEVHMQWIKKTAVPQASRYLPDGFEDRRTPTMCIRTRDASLLKSALAAPDVFVIDVGGQENAGQLNFDHHQQSMTRTWPDGLPLSSTGLIWMWLKTNGHLKDLPSDVLAELEDKLIRPLDAHDNGVEVFPLASQMAGYNRSTADTALQNRQFEAAKSMMNDALDNTLHTASLKHDARIIIQQQWNKASALGDTAVLLSRYVEYHDCAGLLKQVSGGQADLIIIPGQGNRFSITSMSGDAKFSSKCPCPPAWRGRADFTVNVGGKDVMIKFAHKTGFKVVVEGTHKDAQAVARFMVKQNNLAALPAKSSPSAKRPSP